MRGSLSAEALRSESLSWTPYRDGRVEEKARSWADPPFSEQGVQYTALSFGQRLKEVGKTPPMGRTGSALENAMAESFVCTLKAELVDTG